MEKIANMKELMRNINSIVELAEMIRRYNDNQIIKLK